MINAVCPIINAATHLVMSALASLKSCFVASSFLRSSIALLIIYINSCDLGSKNLGRCVIFDIILYLKYSLCFV
jgi:hypothetical protein